MASENHPTEHETERIYLDYNATTPLDPDVLSAITDALRDAWGNPSSPYGPGLKAKKIINKARENLALMVGGKPSDIVFTSGGTEGNNLVLTSAVKYFHKDRHAHSDTVSGDGKKMLPHFISSNLEHDSVKLVLEHLVSEGDIECTFVGASTTSGRVEVEDILAAIRPNTIMISIMLANNETGVIQPVSEIFSRVRKMKRSQPTETSRILLHSDAAQAIGKISVDVGELDVDYLTLVGHKFYGPRIGALYVQDLEKGTPLFPQLFGGGQERNYRPGTENTGMIAGLGKAAELVIANVEKYEEHMREVRDYLENQLQTKFGAKIHFNGKFKVSDRLPNTCNFSFLGAGLEGHKVLSTTRKIQASVGAACHAQNRPSPILLAIGIPEDIARNALRFSVGHKTTFQDVDAAVEDLENCIAQLSEKTGLV